MYQKLKDIFFPKYSTRQKWILSGVWFLVFSPFLGIFFLLLLAKFGLFGVLPNIEEIGKTRNNLATEIYTSDGVLLGKFFNENRQDCSFEEISPNMISALIATEDERFYEHNGIDIISIGRALMSFGKAGGGSTITQQLAKMLFTRTVETNKVKRARDKLKEWIIAVELERLYTKDEILTMYLNRFDFLYNAIGIKSAAKIYFNKLPSELSKIEASILVAMAKNPRLYNPILHPDKANQRKNTVLFQWEQNYRKNNSAIRVPLESEEAEALKKQNVLVTFTKDSHTEGMAPHFREVLRLEVKKLLEQKDKNGNFKFTDAEGNPYDLYRDGLKIYTTLDSRLQANAEFAVDEYLKTHLQKEFYRDIRDRKNWPYDNNTALEDVQSKIWAEVKKTERYQHMKGLVCPKCGRPMAYIEEKENEFICHGEEQPYHFKKYSDKEILKELEKPVKMKVFSWNNPQREKDTLLSPLDSIKYYKSILQAGLLSIQVETGHVKAWVGGHNFKYFKYDHVKQTRRQVGSIFKPFVYATLLRDKNEITPITEILDKEYCIDVRYNKEWTSWCPKSDGHKYTFEPISLKYGLANSLNSVTTWAMSQTSPQAVIKLVGEMGMNTDKMTAVPSLALGVFDVNLLEMLGAYHVFVNNGIYVKPVYLLKIEDRNGNLIYRTPTESRTVLDEKTTFNMLDMLKAVMRGGYKRNGERYLGTGIRLLSPESEGRPYTGLPTGVAIAGKTGTTQSNADGWFIGLTPDLVTGVWIGAEDRNVRFANTAFGQGANTGLPIFGYFMKKNYQDPSLELSLTDFDLYYKFLPADANFSRGQDNVSKNSPTLFDESLFD